MSLTSFRAKGEFPNHIVDKWSIVGPQSKAISDFQGAKKMLNPLVNIHQLKSMVLGKLYGNDNHRVIETQSMVYTISITTAIKDVERGRWGERERLI